MCYKHRTALKSEHAFAVPRIIGYYDNSQTFPVKHGLLR